MKKCFWMNKWTKAFVSSFELIIWFSPEKKKKEDANDSIQILLYILLL